MIGTVTILTSSTPADARLGESSQRHIRALTMGSRVSCHMAITHTARTATKN